jgi:hypothetical protein
MTPWPTDNFLTEDKFQQLQTIILGEEFEWYYMNNIDYLDDTDKFQFTHAFFDQELGGVLSDHYDMFNLIDDSYRIKANLLTRTSKIEVNRFHTDMQIRDSDPYTTSILYMNSNDGYTEFENGWKVESVANRLITFPAGMKHRGTSCTDKKIRVVINFNYLT